MVTLAEQILAFYFSLPDTFSPPNGVKIIHPFRYEETKRVMRLFFERYYNDTNPRTLIFGINPGRHGAGVTGVGFSDPILLEERLGIENSLPKRSELSASFIFEVLEAYGGARTFYGDFLFTTVLPFGLLKDGKNYNYYDDKETLAYFEDVILESIRKQMAFTGVRKDIICIGQGKNLKYLQTLNKKYQLFGDIKVVPHPRWVMQYRRKEKEKYIREYLDILAKVLG